MAIPRRRFLRLAAGGAALASVPQSSRAQAFPSRPITIMVFVGAGGAPDIIARLIGQALSQRIGQPVIIENRPGGGGNLSLQAVARAPADGHTLLLIATPHAVNVTLYEKLGVNVVRDIAPIASINNDAFVMLVNPSSPIKTVAEFIAHAKANPGKVNLTSSGNGNLTHLSGELFRMASGIELVHVPYRNTPAALTALMAGEVHVIFDALPSAMPHVKAGSLRPLGVTAPARVKTLPDVPSISEVGARLCGDRMARTRRTQGHAGRRSSRSSTKTSTRWFPIPRSPRGSPASAASRSPAHPPTSASSSRPRPRSGRRWSGFAGLKIE